MAPDDSPPRFAGATTSTIAAFLRDIGIAVRAGTVSGATALPGIRIDRAAIVIDEERLLHPGDLLHEAGHLAVAAPQRRAAFHHDVGNDAAEEMMAIAWSYAAALHLKIDPALVLHSDGYRGSRVTNGEGGESILANFQGGHYFGVPMLDYLGMTVDIARARREGLTPYPHMIRWLRQAP